MSNTLAPSQQAVCDAFQAAWPQHTLFHLWSYTGYGRSTTLTELHRQLGGVRLTTVDFVGAQIGRDPIAIEDTIFCVIRDALQHADHVFVDDWHLLGNVLSSCGNYPRGGYLEAVGAALAALAHALGKRLVIASDGTIPESLSTRCFPCGISELEVADYRHLCRLFGGDASCALDFEQIHRFAPRLNAYQLCEASSHFRTAGTWSTDTFIEYLRERQLVSNVRLAEVAPVRLEDLRRVWPW